MGLLRFVGRSVLTLIVIFMILIVLLLMLIF